VINTTLVLLSKYRPRPGGICMGSDFSDEKVINFTSMGFQLIRRQHTRIQDNIHIYIPSFKIERILEEFLIHLNSEGLMIVFMNTKP
jgi:hypothetical protein